MIMAMKPRLILLIVPLLFLIGCSGVQLNAEYSKLLDDTAALAETAAQRGEARTLAPDDQVKTLRWNADAWQKFRAGRDGKKTVTP